MNRFTNIDGPPRDLEREEETRQHIGERERDIAEDRKDISVGNRGGKTPVMIDV